MEPRIQYAQTTDGVSIAYWTLGQGEPLVHLPWAGVSHLQLDWEYPEYRLWYERLAERRMLVRYDSRGTGMSDRQAPDFSVEGFMLDLEAVTNSLRLDRIALLGLVHSGIVASIYAARHPERVSHLLLWCSYARASDYLESSPELQVLRAAAGKDWDTYIELAASLNLGWSEGEQARKFSAYLRECFTQEFYNKLIGSLQDFNVSNLLLQLTVPTLILHRRQVVFPKVDIARGLASRIPGARLALFEGTSGVPFLGDTDPVIAAVDEFLDEGAEAAAAPGLAADDVHTILFTDIEGSTALTQRLGDAKARDLLREHERMVREALKAHGGSEVKTMGDGFMASFSSATKALGCAISMQRAFADHNESAEQPILVRIGLNAGEPIAEDDDLFGRAVNEAARITAAAMGGEILVSNVVRELAKGKDFLFADRGEANLKGFDEPVRLYELRWRESG